MQSKATSVAAYLQQLPADRRESIEAVRRAVRRALPKGYEEGMQYGMIGYYVPHSVYAPGYHCDPKQPLPFAGLASQKQHMSLYLMGLCGVGSDENERAAKFRAQWAKTGKKLDMGKACIRFKRVEDLAIEAITDAIAGLPVDAYVAEYELVLAERGIAHKGKKLAKTPEKKPELKVAKKPETKVTKKAAKKVGKQAAKR